MNESPKNDGTPPPPAQGAKPARKKYQKPAIVTREKIEGRANVCDPGIGGKSTVACAINRS